MSSILAIFSFILFVCFQAQHITPGDGGDLLTAAATRGVPHPPGYPLYTMLGWLLSHIPAGTIVWRIGLLSSIPHALVVGLMYVIVLRLTRRRSAGVFASLLLIGNYLFFLYSVTPEVFALLDFFVIVLTYLALRWQKSHDMRFLDGIFLLRDCRLPIIR